MHGHIVDAGGRGWVPDWDEKDGECSPPFVAVTAGRQRYGATAQSHKLLTAESKYGENSSLVYPERRWLFTPFK